MGDAPRPKRSTIDPFVLSEPWRQLMQGAQSSGRKLRATVDGTSAGPLKDILQDIADQLERGLERSMGSCQPRR